MDKEIDFIIRLLAFMGDNGFNDFNPKEKSRIVKFTSEKLGVSLDQGCGGCGKAGMPASGNIAAQTVSSPGAIVPNR